jgi:thioesterase domain-containing protein
VLVSRLARAYAAAIPPQIIFERPTIDLLAQYLRQEVALLPPSCLIPIKARGSRPPLFCVHPGGGLVHSYIDLARHLDPDQPLYAFQAGGLDDDRALVTDLVEMARNYVSAMRAFAPHGPYHLAGLSLGSTVVFEMAQQLHAMGESVGLLAILDGKYVADEHGWTGDRMPPEILEWEEMHVRDELEVIWSLDEETIAAMTSEERLARYLALEKQAGRVPRDVSVDQFARLLRVYGTNVRARHAYQPRPYPGRLTLFRTDVPADLDEAYGWRALARGGVDIHPFEGEHGALMRPPQVRGLAEQLQTLIHTSAEYAPSL